MPRLSGSNSPWQQAWSLTLFPRICRRAAPSAEFSVDRHRHLMSFLTMLGPSPDWNVGLSAEDLCTKDCGWVQKVVQDLIPWDAGTDSGVTYEVQALSVISSHILYSNIQFNLNKMFKYFFLNPKTTWEQWSRKQFDPRWCPPCLYTFYSAKIFFFKLNKNHLNTC